MTRLPASDRIPAAWCVIAILATLFLAAFAAPSRSEAPTHPRLKLAVLELRNSEGITPDEAAYLTDRVRDSAARLLPVGDCLVMSRESMAALLPAGADLSGCSAGDCEVEAGRMVGADYIVTGEILKFDGALRLNLKAHHCESGALLGGESVAGAKLTALEAGLDRGANRLLARVCAHAGLPAPPPEPEPATPPATKPMPAAVVAPVAQQVSPPVAPAQQSPPPAVNAAQVTVYVTKSGACYHVAGCRSLSRSAIPMSLAEAAARYRPCSVCRPPLPSAGDASASPPSSRPRTEVAPVPRGPSASGGGGQCQAITKKGTRCSRQAKAGSSYCWQHQR